MSEAQNVSSRPRRTRFLFWLTREKPIWNDKVDVHMTKSLAYLKLALFSLSVVVVLKVVGLVMDVA